MTKIWAKGYTVQSYDDSVELLQYLWSLMFSQRGDDKARFSSGDVSQYGSAIYGERANSRLCVAYSVMDGSTYVGYSGRGGNFPGAGIVRKSDPEKRLDSKINERRERIRFNIQFPEGDPANLQRAIEKCAEASALSTALTYGVVCQELIFVTFSPNGLVADLCSNCRTWVPGQAWGYYTSSDVRNLNFFLRGSGSEVIQTD